MYECGTSQAEPIKGWNRCQQLAGGTTFPLTQEIICVMGNKMKDIAKHDRQRMAEKSAVDGESNMEDFLDLITAQQIFVTLSSNSSIDNP
jgi:hypothetical protein